MEKINITYKDFCLSESEYNFLVKHICENQSSVFIFGGVASGKITFSNLLIKEFDNNELISVVGDTHDYIFHENQKVSEIFIKDDDDYSIAFDLIIRSNPDRILVPDLSVSNVSLILKAIKSRLKGFMLTMYSPNENTEIAEVFSENLKIAGVNEVDTIAIDKTINSNIDFLIHLKKHKEKYFVDKVVINNLEAQKEAQKLGIFGFNLSFKEKFKKHLKENVEDFENVNSWYFALGIPAFLIWTILSLIISEKIVMHTNIYSTMFSIIAVIPIIAILIDSFMKLQRKQIIELEEKLKILEEAKRR